MQGMKRTQGLNRAVSIKLSCLCVSCVSRSGVSQPLQPHLRHPTAPVYWSQGVKVQTPLIAFHSIASCAVCAELVGDRATRGQES